MNILVLTDVLPVPMISGKNKENDVLLSIADMHEDACKDVRYTFVFVLAISLFSFILRKKWKELRAFRDSQKYTYGGREVTVIAVPTFRWIAIFRSSFTSLGYLLNRGKIKKLIEKEKIDLVHAHNVYFDAGIAYTIYKKFAIPYIVTTRRLGWVKLDKHIRKYLSKAKALISLRTEPKGIADLMNDNSYLIPHGINNCFLNQVKDYSETEEPLRIISVTRLLDWKNLDKVLLALDRLKCEFVYDIYGDGPDKERLVELLSRMSIMSKVTFKGHVQYDLIPEVLAKYDIFVLPSYREHFGRVYIEAMACGLPVIAAKNTGIDGYIENGVHGFLVDHNNIAELTEAIEKFGNEADLKRRLGKKAKELSATFAWDTIIDKLDTIYRSSVKE